MDDTQLLKSLKTDENIKKSNFTSNEKGDLPSSFVTSLLDDNTQDQNKDTAVVVSEIPITNTTLHQIASGKCQIVGQPGEAFAVRFMLKGSFKSSRSKYVVNNMIMQIVAVGKRNVMRKENMAVLTKVETVQPKLVPKKDKVKVKADEYVKEEGVEEI